MSSKHPSASGRPRLLLVTDRVPGNTVGNEFRVANVVEGLLAVGELHVCLIDSSVEGAEFATDSRFEQSVVRAAELPRWLRIMESLWAIPHLRYGQEEALRTKMTDAIQDREWDLIWFSRARTHRIASPLFSGAHILDLDDLNDRLLMTLAQDRKNRLGRVRSLPRGFIDWLTARRWHRRYEVLERVVDRLIVCHAGDATHLDASGVTVVPNGYPHIAVEPRQAPRANSILFVGPISYEPNYLAVRWFVEEVLDLVRVIVPDATLSVVGAQRNERQTIDHPGVVLHGWVPDVTPHYDQAAVAIAPLFSGGGTRIKVLEAMARRCPMVATSFAVEGLGLDLGSDVLIANEPRAFADHCIQLLGSASVGAALADRAHRTFCEDHGADISATAVADVAAAVLAEHMVDTP